MTALSTPSPPAHDRTGLRRVLEVPRVYDALQNFVQPVEAKRQFVQEFIPVTPGARVLDIGCGTGQILEYLPESIEYVGYDLNPSYIARARDAYGHRGRFFCGSVSADEAPKVGQEFDVVLALSVLHHLSDDEGKRLVESAHAQLKPKGVFVTFDPVYQRGQSFVARFIISRDRGRCVRNAEGYRELGAHRFSTIKSEIRTDLLRIPYTHHIMHCAR